MLNYASYNSAKEGNPMPPEDRRVRRTRRLLRDALVSLVLERGYAGITVEDITDRADLGRATFYSHYTDKDDLLGQVVSDLADDLNPEADGPGWFRSSAPTRQRSVPAPAKIGRAHV